MNYEIHAYLETRRVIQLKLGTLTVVTKAIISITSLWWASCCSAADMLGLCL